MKKDKKNNPENADMKPEETDHINELLDEEEFDDEVLSDLELMELKLKEAEEKLLRQAADSDNYRKRMIRETDDKIKYANQSILTKFLPVLDNFELALIHIDGASVESIVEGIVLNHKVMLDTLEKAGLSRVPVEVGDSFNPVMHEAIMLGHDSELPNNSVMMIIQSGYKMGDRIVRPAKVQVNKVD